MTMSVYLLQQLLTESASRCGERVAVLLKNETVTYLELEERSNQLARLLERNGVRPGDRVGLMLEKSIEAIVSVYGVLKTGAVYVPIDPATPAGRAHRILSGCDARNLIASYKSAQSLFGDHAPAIGYLDNLLLVDQAARGLEANLFPVRTESWESLSGFPASPVRKPRLTEMSPAYILHTSGSTGIPKGVVISHRNAMAFIEMASDYFGIRPTDRLGNHAPLNFDLSMFDIYLAARAGATLVLVPETLSVFPIRLAEYIRNNSITIWNSVSSVLSLLATRGSVENSDFDKLRTVIFSGEVLPVKHLKHLMKHMPDTSFFNLYGQTEANSSTCFPIDHVPENDNWKIPIGRPFPNFEVFLLDDGGNVVDGPGTEGEIYVKSATVAMGYWGDGDKTREKFVQDPRTPEIPTLVYRTGDLARLDESGNLLFCGRKDHLIKSRGYRVELDEIEIAVNGLANIDQAVAIPVADSVIGNRIVVCASQVPGSDLDEHAVISRCSEMLPKYMVPEKVFFLDRLPKNPNNKIDRAVLLKHVIEQVGQENLGAGMANE